MQLSTANPHLLILGARAEEKVTPIAEKIKSAAPDIKIRFLDMDLGDMSSIRQAVDTLRDVPKIDHLVCVAGVMVPPYGTTKDGFETQFGVNYLANFLLIKLLLPKVRLAGVKSSVVIVASSAVRSGKVEFGDVGFSVRLSALLLVCFGLIVFNRRAKHMILWWHMPSRTLPESCL